MADAVIFDRGYRPYEGEREGRMRSRLAIFKDGVRRILGLRRKARRKILPWTLITIALVAAAVFIGLHYAASSLGPQAAARLPGYGELFDFYSRIALLFIAVAGPELLAPDRARGVLSVYFSRPITVGDYLTAKGAAYLASAGSIYVVPQVLLFIGLAALSTTGFLSYIGHNLDVLWKIPAVTAAYLVVHGSVVGVLASYVKRTGMAAAAFLGVIIGSGAVAQVAVDSPVFGARWVALVGLDQHARIIRDWLFSSQGIRVPAQVAGFSPWASVYVIAGIGVAAAVWITLRYRKLA